MAFQENHSRSIVKALTYRGIILVSDATLIYLITGNFKLTIGFVGISNVASTFLYFVHERIWNEVHWGKKEFPHHHHHEVCKDPSRH